MFVNLITGIHEDTERDIEKTTERIRNDAGGAVARSYATDTRWRQYQQKEISLDELKAFAIQRMEKRARRDEGRKVDKVSRIEAAPSLKRISIIVEWSKAHNATSQADVMSDGRFERFAGHAGGGGYDKGSTAVAAAINKSDSVLRELYLYKERRMEDGETDAGRYSFRDNRDIIGYGAGYDILPYFEGGVGCDCFWRIFEKIGFETRIVHAKNTDVYLVG